MRNIELKARVRDLAAAEETAKRLPGREPHATLVQRDTYFNVPEGRLKLREITGSEELAELIFYRRPNELGIRRCEYEIAPVSEPGATKRLLAAALGVRCVVEKRRTVYLWKPAGGVTVRIHLDRVEGLGEFVEFEAVMPDGAADSEGEALLGALTEEFGIRREDTFAGSYADMVRDAL